MACDTIYTINSELIKDVLFSESSAAAGSRDNSNKKRQIIMVIGIVVGSGALLFGLAVFLAWKRRTKPNTENVLDLIRGTS